MNRINYSVSLGKIKFSNPLLAASGTFGYGKEFSSVSALSSWGGFITKTLTLNPRRGNPVPRIYEVRSGVINSIGLENEGLKNFLDNKVALIKKYKTKVIVSIYGEDQKQWLSLIEGITSVISGNIIGLELNFSCPNVHGKIISHDKILVKKILKALRKKTSKMLIPKLSFSPNIEQIAKVCEDYGADAVTVMNTVSAIALDINTKKPILGNIFGGLSGPAIKHIAQAAVYKTYKKISIPILASGGVFDYKDVLEFMLAGATLVQLGTVNFTDTDISKNILKGVNSYLLANKYKSIQKIIGAANV